MLIQRGGREMMDAKRGGRGREGNKKVNREKRRDME